MYDYLAKIILLGPSGSGKSCLLHRFIKSEWRTLTSQTIGVEFASKIIKVGSGARRKRIKLQLWDTAGTERFRSVSRSYYRGAAGAVLVYDIASHATFAALAPFLNDARALASPNLTVVLVGNKLDLAEGSDLAGGEDGAGSEQQNEPLVDVDAPPADPSTPSTPPRPKAHHPSHSHVPSTPPAAPATPSAYGSVTSTPGLGLGAQLRASTAPDGRAVSTTTASRWASTLGGGVVAVTTEASALSGEGVDAVFERLARIILTKIELGEIDPDDPASGIQYGDSGTAGMGAGGGGRWDAAGSDGASVRSGFTIDGAGGGGHRRRNNKARSGALGGMREWEEVFTMRTKRRGCCGG